MKISRPMAEHNGTLRQKNMQPRVFPLEHDRISLQRDRKLGALVLSVISAYG